MMSNFIPDEIVLTNFVTNLSGTDLVELLLARSVWYTDVPQQPFVRFKLSHQLILLKRLHYSSLFNKSGRGERI